MSSLAVSQGFLELPKDSGKATHTGLTLEEYWAFGALVRAYQETHPDTLVRTRGNFNRRLGYGTITVTWWPRGETEPEL